jgi:hypothetical protein
MSMVDTAACWELLHDAITHAVKVEVVRSRSVSECKCDGMDAKSV